MGRKKGVSLSLVMMVFEIFSTLLITPLIIRTLGQAEYGVYKLSFAIVSYLLLLDLGVGNAVVRYIAKYRFENDSKNASKFLGVSTIYYMIVGVISLVVGIVLVQIYPFVFAKGLNSQEILLGQKLLMVTMLTNVITLATSAYANTINAYERFGISKGLGIIQCVIKICLIYTAMKLGMGSLALVFIDFILTVFCRVFFVVYVFAKLKIFPNFKNIEFKYVMEIVVYSTFILLQMIATQVNTFTDQILIGSIVKDSSIILGIYAVGQQISNYYQHFGSAFNSVLMPGVVRLVQSKGRYEMQQEMVRVGRIIFSFVAVIYVAFVVCGKNFVLLWSGKENENAFYVALIYMTCYLFILPESIGSQILWALNEHKEQSIMKLLVVVINLVFTVALIKWNPLIGASIGTGISLLVGDILIMNLIVKKKLGIVLTKYYKDLLTGIAPSILITAIVGFSLRIIVADSWLMLILKTAIIVVLYSICMFTFGLRPGEKEHIKGYLRKFLNK